jgi:hypothetical protein
LQRPAAFPSSIRKNVVREEGGRLASVLGFSSARNNVEVFMMRFDAGMGREDEKFDEKG